MIVMFSDERKFGVFSANEVVLQNFLLEAMIEKKRKWTE